MTAPVEPTGLGAIAIRTYEGVTTWAVRDLVGDSGYPWAISPGREVCGIHERTDWSFWASVGDVEILHPGVPPEHLTRPAEPTEPGTVRDLIDSDGELVLRVMRTDTARSCNWKCSDEVELSWPEVCHYADRVHLTIVDPFAPTGGAS